MSYSLTIGKARYIPDPEDLEDHGGYLWTVAECDGPAPHSDPWEMSPFAGSPCRSPGYSQWHEVLTDLPTFAALWKRLTAWAQAEHRSVIPVTEYVRELDEVEREAEHGPDESAARAWWFCRWSRHALNIYGEAAAFETPGEWVNWPSDVEVAAA